VEGPTMENARRCLVAVLARGTNSWPVAVQCDVQCLSVE